jgi:hypothetical protein
MKKEATAKHRGTNERPPMKKEANRKKAMYSTK